METVPPESLKEKMLVAIARRRTRSSLPETNRGRIPLTPQVVITAHGVSHRERARLAAAGKELIDTTCPPEGIYATINQIKAPKKVVLMPQRGHGGDHGAYYASYGPFLEEQKK